ncbi:MAG TPA: DNA replication and repair protein RecF [Solirubrobacteraceae bacterium]|nr:DNA replication and repair protein RecF [Solirubrobacteraceae bacterium]
MVITRVRLRDFRSYERADIKLGPGLTVVTGRNGAGKTNLLEAVCVGATARSPRTVNERRLVRFGAELMRVELTALADDGEHELSVALRPGEPKRMRVDGVAVQRMVCAGEAPFVSVFEPDRLELVKGTPALRRVHLDRVVGAFWPARMRTRRAYGTALAQRNALLVRVRNHRASAESLAAWDGELARHGIELMNDRRSAVAELAPRFVRIAAELGLEGEIHLLYRPRSRVASAEELAGELAERTAGDLERGFTGHGPHRDELALRRDGRELRGYGSQGQQRLALLALLLAEREALAEARDRPPLLLLDDVMSELDRERRERLVALVRESGQTVITSTDAGQVPGADHDDVTRLAVTAGAVLAEAVAA